MRIHASMTLLAALLAGCLAAPPHAELTTTDITPLAFNSAGGKWIAIQSGGCGLCSGQGNFGPHAEHHALFVFDDARVVLVEFNVAIHEDAVMSVGPNITYETDELQSLLQNVPRAREGHAYIVRVHTGLATLGTPAALARGWTTPGPVEPAADYAAHYAYARDTGAAEHVELRGGLADDDPFHAFMDHMARLTLATRAHGALQGAPPR